MGDELHPAIAGLLTLLPPPGRPFPALEDWLSVFRDTLDLVWPEPLAPRLEVEVPTQHPALAVLDAPREQQSIDVRALKAGDRAELSAAFERRDGRAVARVLGNGGSEQPADGSPRSANGMPKKRCPGYAGFACQNWITYNSQHCRSCVGALKAGLSTSKTGRKVGRHPNPPRDPAIPVDSAGNPKHRCPGYTGHECENWISKQAEHCRGCFHDMRRTPLQQSVANLETGNRAGSLRRCECVNPDLDACQVKAPLGILSLGEEPDAARFNCRLFLQGRGPSNWGKRIELGTKPAMREFGRR